MLQLRSICKLTDYISDMISSRSLFKQKLRLIEKFLYSSLGATNITKIFILKPYIYERCSSKGNGQTPTYLDKEPIYTL